MKSDNAIAYDVIYKGYLNQTRTKVACLEDAAKMIYNSGLDTRHFVIENNLTGESLIYENIKHYIELT